MRLHKGLKCLWRLNRGRRRHSYPWMVRGVRTGACAVSCPAAIPTPPCADMTRGLGNCAPDILSLKMRTKKALDLWGTGCVDT